MSTDHLARPSAPTLSSAAHTRHWRLSISACRVRPEAPLLCMQFSRRGVLLRVISSQSAWMTGPHALRCMRRTVFTATCGAVRPLCILARFVILSHTWWVNMTLGCRRIMLILTLCALVSMQICIFTRIDPSPHNCLSSDVLFGAYLC